MYRIAVCDDEESFLDYLCQKTEEYLTGINLVRGNDFEIEKFSTAAQLLDRLLEAESVCQLLLLDIELDGENGMELARTLRRHQMTCSIVYITSYRDFVFDCFDTQPLWYLLKPLNEEKFKEILLSDYLRNYAHTRLLLKIDGRQITIPFSAVYALESTQHRTRIWLEEGYRDWNGALSALKPQLPSLGFCQCHNSYIINLSHVREIQRTDALMDNGKSFPISRRCYEQTFEKYFAFLKV